MARKSGGFAFRSNDARNKPFETLYYTADIHAGAQHLPPFVSKAFG